MRNKVQLITYVDRLSGGGFKALTHLLTAPTSPLAGLFGGVHALPFFDPIDGSDAGFDPSDHTKVDPRLGDWSDVAHLAQQVDLMGDLIVNHVSSSSPQYLDWSTRGAASAYDGLFLTMDAVFPLGARESDLLAIYRPRPGLPFRYTTMADGRKAILWTTFTPQQVDIDVEHPQGLAYLHGILETFTQAGVKVIRLDAVGYAVKRPGTSCFMLPETMAFVDALTVKARAAGMEVLVEVHAHHQKQIELARRVDWVYDFALPPLILHALNQGDVHALNHWVRIRPNNALNVLDTHDGIGIVDIGADAADGSPGLISPRQLDELVEAIHANSQGQSREATGNAASNLDLYQVNCTFYDALGRDDAAYLMARAVQFFLPGIPQVYYVGLLAGHNDMDLLGRSKVGRDINRHHYAPGDLARETRRPVVQDLFALIRLRNDHLAFAGRFEADASASPSELRWRWRNGTAWVQLHANVATRQMSVTGHDGHEATRLSLACIRDVDAPTLQPMP